MTKTIALVVILALRLVYQPSKAQQTIAPFASQLPTQTAAAHIAPVKIIHFTGTVRNDKTLLEWAVSENEMTSVFEVEKSMDGLNYHLAAVVFGTDLPNNANYQFFEKASHQKILYRIKLVKKDQSAQYSSVIEIAPSLKPVV